MRFSDYIVTSWTMKDGLPSDVIWTMAQDRRRVSLARHQRRLVRFDGVRFRDV